MRDTLFGDSPISAWPATVAPNIGEPWKSFVQAREALARGRKDEAISTWRRITAMSGLESRHYLQAWHFLTQQGFPAITFPVSDSPGELIHNLGGGPVIQQVEVRRQSGLEGKTP